MVVLRLGKIKKNIQESLVWGIWKLSWLYNSKLKYNPFLPRKSSSDKDNMVLENRKIGQENRIKQRERDQHIHVHTITKIAL